MSLVSEIKNFFSEVSDEQVRLDLLVKLGKPRFLARVSGEKALEMIEACRLPLRFWFVEFLRREKKLSLREACALFGYHEVTHLQHLKSLSDEVVNFYIESMRSFFERVLARIIS